LPLEIERKFLVVGDAWRAAAHARSHIRQGYLAKTAQLNVRVRLIDDRAWLTLKSREPGAVRQEFDYPIPAEDAAALLARCEGAPIEKVRHVVLVAGRVWTVDEFLGGRAGLVLAECELEAADAPLVLPDWAGAEVTDDPAYRNENL
jgi:adenylate cyclase